MHNFIPNITHTLQQFCNHLSHILIVKYFSKIFRQKIYKLYEHSNYHVWCISLSDSLVKSIY